MSAVYFKLGAVKCYSGYQVLRKVVGSVPTNWYSMSGKLYAPRLFFDNDRVLKDTGFEFGSRCDGRNVLIPREKKEREADMPIIDLNGFVQGKRPSFVELVEAGAYGKDRSAFIRAIDVAIAYLEIGYRGKLDIVRDSRGPTSDHSALCQLRTDPEDERRTRPLKPWYLKVEWNERSSGSREAVQPILEMCEALGIPDFRPERWVTSSA